MRSLSIMILLVSAACARPQSAEKSTLPILPDSDCDRFIKRQVLNGTLERYETAIFEGVEYRLSAECKAKINAQLIDGGGVQ
jgi:hypothetical protein